jgi:hypothetical protein
MDAGKHAVYVGIPVGGPEDGPVDNALCGLDACFRDVEGLVAHVDVGVHLDATAGQVQSGQPHAQQADHGEQDHHQNSPVLRAAKRRSG